MQTHLEKKYSNKATNALSRVLLEELIITYSESEKSIAESWWDVCKIQYRARQIFKSQTWNRHWRSCTSKTAFKKNTTRIWRWRRKIHPWTVSSWDNKTIKLTLEFSNSQERTGEVRVCVDCQHLNEHTVKDVYPLPRIDMYLDCLTSTKLFSTVDLQRSCMQLELAEEEQHKKNSFHHQVWVIWICQDANQGLQWKILLVYLDDIVVVVQSINKGIE